MTVVRSLRRLPVLVGSAVVVAAACLAVAGAVAARSPVPSPLALAGCLVLVFVGVRFHLSIRLGAQRVELTWSEAAVVVVLAFTPAPWVVLLTPVAVAASYAQRRVAAVKTLYNVAIVTVAAAAAAAVLALAGVARPFAGADLVVLAAAGAVAGLVTYLAVAAVIAVVQDVPLLATWRASAGLQLLTLLGNLGVAVGVLVLARYEPWLVAALPVVVLCLHQGYEGRLRGHQEREAGLRHAAAVGRLTVDLDEPGVLRRSAEAACGLVEADVVDVELPGYDGVPAVLYRHRRQGQPWSGDPADAAAVPARLVAELPIAMGVDAPAGRLRVWLASSAADLRLGQGEETALTSLAMHTGGAVANARAHAQQTFHASHDPVTGLPNRRVLLARVDALPSRARDDAPGSVALALIDVSGYRDIVRAVGHDVAEWLLTYTADRLRAVAEPAEFVAHVGADDFAVLFTEPLGPAHVRDRVQRMLASVATPVTIAVGTVELSARAGIGYSPRPGMDGAELLRQATVGLDKARSAPCVPLEFYDPADDPVGSPSAIVLASELQAALDGDQLELCYQPMVSLPGGVPRAVEALVRWHHPTRGLLEPAEFVPVLERSPVHARYVEWLLAKALGTRALWGTRDLPVTVNVAAQCVLDLQFPRQVAAALERSRLAGDQLILELAESAALGVAGPVERVLSDLRKLGVQVAIDEFGTGYGSVRRIRHVPVTHLKIASRFVEDMLVDDDAATVVRIAMEMGRGYGLEVVALGVGTDEQVAALTALGCRAAQGRDFATLTGADLREYLLAAPTEEPAPDADVIPLDRRRRSTPGQ